MSYKQEVETEEQLTALKEKCLKCKVILMEKKGKHPLSNLSLFSKRQKDLFLRELDEMMKTMPDEQITNEFNAIVCDDLFSNTNDYTTYHTLEKAEPDHSILYRPEPETEQEYDQKLVKEECIMPPEPPNVNEIIV